MYTISPQQIEEAACLHMSHGKSKDTVEIYNLTSFEAFKAGARWAAGMCPANDQMPANSQETASEGLLKSNAKCGSAWEMMSYGFDQAIKERISDANLLQSKLNIANESIAIKDEYIAKLEQNIRNACG